MCSHTLVYTRLPMHALISAFECVCVCVERMRAFCVYASAVYVCDACVSVCLCVRARVRLSSCF